MRITKLSEKYGIAIQNIYKIIRAADIPRERNKKFTEEQYQEVRGLYLGGWTMRDIEAETGISRQNCNVILKKAGIKLTDKPKPKKESREMRQMLEKVVITRKDQFPRVKLNGKWYIDVSSLWGI